MDCDYLLKMIVIGSTGVGKTSIVKRFVDNLFDKNQETTIGVEFGSKKFTVSGQQVKLQLWDTAGQETFLSVTKSYYKSSAAVLLVYDITNRNSFDDLTEWMERLEENANSDITVCIIGNKTDLKDK